MMHTLRKRPVATATYRSQSARASRAAVVPLLLLAFVGACSSDGPTEPDPPPVTEPEAPEPTVPAEATDWLNANVIPLDGSDLQADLSDLDVLRSLVGDARIVSLGEGTHGTREFFQMKHRILRFLVEEMGFDAIAMEATWAESNRLDDYVRTGNGDARELLSGLYFWTWNTESVLDMVGWLRGWNEAGHDVGFYGFDMRFPGMALHNVDRFLEVVDPEAAPSYDERLECLRPFVNGPDGRFPTPSYGAQSTLYRSLCRGELQWAMDSLRVEEDRYVGLSSRAAFEHAERSLRILEQWELQASDRGSRDVFMAENVDWLLDQLGPDGKLVLWAHNSHVARLPSSMGGELDARHGDDMVVLGFAFGEGQFSAVTMAGSSFVDLESQTAAPPRIDSYEMYFATANAPTFLLPLRGLDLSPPEASWMTGPRQMRFIGCCYDPARSSAFHYTARLPEEFDALVWVAQTTATRLLPFRYPQGF